MTVPEEHAGDVVAAFDGGDFEMRQDRVWVNPVLQVPEWRLPLIGCVFNDGVTLFPESRDIQCNIGTWSDGMGH